MTDDGRPSIGGEDITDTRFSVRAMLVTMATVAIVAAVLGAVVRSIDSNERIPLLVTWGGWLAASIAWVGFLTHQRRDAEKLVGRSHLKLPLYDENVPDVSPGRLRFNFVMSIVLVLLAISMLSIQILSSPIISVTSSNVSSFAIMAAFCVWWTARAITSMWWRSNVRFGERGILWDRRALMWDHIASWDWDARRSGILDIRGVDQFNRDMDLRVRVPESLRYEVESLVESRVVPKSAVDIQMPGNMLARAPISDAIREPGFLKVLGFYLLIFLGMILTPYLFSSGFTGIREFDEAVLFGFAGFSIARANWRVGPIALAGVPIARLRSSRRLWLALVILLPMGVTYWVGITIGGTAEYVGYASGLGFGALASLAVDCLVESLWKTPFDLRSNGIFVRGKFWPWKEVKVVCWEPRTGKLDLRRGISKISSNVPAEQRELIDTVLREKTGVSKPDDGKQIPRPDHPSAEVGHVE